MKNLLIIAAVTFAFTSVAEANNNLLRTNLFHSGYTSFSGGSCATGNCGSPCGGGCGGCGSHFGFLKRGCDVCAQSCNSCSRRRPCDLFAYIHGGTYCTKWSSMSCADGWNYLCYRLRKCHRGLRYGCCGCCPYTGYQPPHMGCGSSSATMMEEAVEPADDLPPSPAPPMNPPTAKEKSARWIPNGNRVLQGIVF